MIFIFKVKPQPVEPNGYEELKQTITTELEKIDEQQNPGEVPRLVISVASNLNFDNNNDSKSVENRKQVNSLKKKCNFKLTSLIMAMKFNILC